MASKFMVGLADAGELAARINRERESESVDQLVRRLMARGQGGHIADELADGLRKIASGTGPEAAKARRGLRVLGIRN